MPKVSVVLTSFNHEKYIREAIDSVLNQTFSDFELIIWDDASTDGTWDVINHYTDSRIIKYRNDTNKRGIYGINKAISTITKGEYIAIHHSDDVWMPDKLKQQVTFLRKHPEYGAVFTNALAMNEDGSKLIDETHFYTNIFKQHNRSRYDWLNYFLTNGNVLCHPSVLIRKRCYDDCGLYRYGFAQLGDFDMWVRLCMRYEIYVMEESLVKFRVQDNEANTSGNTLAMRSRIFTEYYLIIKNYLMLSNYADIVKIFPEAIKYKTANNPVVEFVLAQVILAKNGFALSKLFALELLFGVINDSRKSDMVYKDYGFNSIDYVRLTKKYGIANKYIKNVEDDLVKINVLTTELDLLGQKYNKLSNEFDAMKLERDKIVNTMTWKLSRPLRMIARGASSIIKRSIKV